MSKVAIFGGGVAGLSAAQELIRFGLDVTVYESSATYGGKAKNQAAPDMNRTTPPTGRVPFVGEHGFRFFPGFYRNLIMTMAEIPKPGGAGRVTDDLVPSNEAGLAKAGVGVRGFLRRLEVSNAWQVYSRLQTLYSDLDFTPEDIARMAWFRLKYATSCDQRREDQYEHERWWDFVEGNSDRYSENFREFEKSIPSTMSALVAETSSARVIGNITMQFLFGPFRPWEEPDRLLTGATNEKWLDPWVAYLTGEGVIFEENHTLDRLELNGAKDAIMKAVVVTTDDSGNETTIEIDDADYYLVAVPLEVMKERLLRNSPDMAADPNLEPLARTSKKMVGDMVGAQFVLKEDQPMVEGHVFYPRSPWALSSVSQGQFWDPKIEERYGDGSAKGILSVVISNWETPDRNGLAAGQCTDKHEVLDSVLQQLRDAVADSDLDLSDDNIAGRHLDEEIRFDGTNGRPVVNGTPLLIHPVSGNDDRPEPHNPQGIANLFLASDYIRTSTSLASMEAANEAARLASRAILIADGMESDNRNLPIVEALREEPVFEAAKKLDALRYERGENHIMDEPLVRVALDVPAAGTQLLELLLTVPGTLLAVAGAMD